jgi:hypothetical protein
VVGYEETQLFKTGKRVKLMGMGFGIAVAALNTSLTILPIIAASIRVYFGSFMYLELFFVFLAIVGVFVCALLFIEDVKIGNALQRSTQKGTCQILRTTVIGAEGDFPAFAKASQNNRESDSDSEESSSNRPNRTTYLIETMTMKSASSMGLNRSKLSHLREVTDDSLSSVE